MSEAPLTGWKCLRCHLPLRADEPKHESTKNCIIALHDQLAAERQRYAGVVEALKLWDDGLYESLRKQLKRTRSDPESGNIVIEHGAYVRLLALIATQDDALAALEDK